MTGSCLDSPVESPTHFFSTTFTCTRTPPSDRTTTTSMLHHLSLRRLAQARPRTLRQLLRVTVTCGAWARPGLYLLFPAGPPTLSSSLRYSTNDEYVADPTLLGPESPMLFPALAYAATPSTSSPNRNLHCDTSALVVSAEPPRQTSLVGTVSFSPASHH